MIRHWSRLAIAVIAWSACVLDAAAQDDPTSATDDRLKRQLERFPKSDANEDGVLTLEEWRAFNADRRRQVRAAERDAGRPVRPTPDHADVRYGPHDRNVCDIYLASGDSPTPLVVYFHGGGFVGGDKQSVSPALIAAMHEAGISVAAVNYRLIETDPFPTPFEDAARAVQFLRANAEQYNIDAARLAATGGSAGGGISLWLALHDDFADPDSSDSVARQSTRLMCAQVNNSQVSYDPAFWHEHGMARGLLHPSFPKMYGLQRGQTRISDPDKVRIAQECSPIVHASPDDPPIALMYGGPEDEITGASSVGAIVHHPRHGRVLKARLDELGVPCYVLVRGDRGENPGAFEFLVERLGGASAGDLNDN